MAGGHTSSNGFVLNDHARWRPADEYPQGLEADPYPGLRDGILTIADLTVSGHGASKGRVL